MEKFIINFTNVETTEGFYEAIMRGLKFRDACGRNPDAIWDNIVCNFRCSSVIYIKGIYKMIKYYEKDVKLFIDILNETKEWYEKFNEYIYIIFLD